MDMSKTNPSKEQTMSTNQINTRASIIRHAIINATRFDDNRHNTFTWECLFKLHGAVAMGDAHCYLPSDFDVIVDMAREAIRTGSEQQEVAA